MYVRTTHTRSSVKIAVNIADREPNLPVEKYEFEQPIVSKASATSDSEECRIVLLLRGHMVNEDMLRRIEQYIESCKKRKPHVDIWLSLDTTSVSGQAALVKTWFGSKTKVASKSLYVHEYNSSDMAKAFPKLSTASAKAFKKWRSMSLALGFHSEVTIFP